MFLNKNPDDVHRTQNGTLLLEPLNPKRFPPILLLYTTPEFLNKQPSCFWMRKAKGASEDLYVFPHRTIYFQLIGFSSNWTQQFIVMILRMYSVTVAIMNEVQEVILRSVSGHVQICALILVRITFTSSERRCLAVQGHVWDWLHCSSGILWFVDAMQLFKV